MARLFCRKILRFSSSAFICLYLLFLLERKMCIKHGHDNFCTMLIYYVEHRKKILNMLFDTFHNTKYFHAHIYALACPFCVGYFTYPNDMKILW
jgi:hypothetical protein